MKQWKYFLEHELPSVKWLLAISEMASRYQRNAFSLSKKFLAKDLEKYKTYCIFARENVFYFILSNNEKDFNDRRNGNVCAHNECSGKDGSRC